MTWQGVNKASCQVTVGGNVADVDITTVKDRFSIFNSLFPLLLSLSLLMSTSLTLLLFLSSLSLFSFTSHLSLSVF